MRKISSLPGESPSHSPPTLCLGSDLLSAPPHASSLSSPTPLPTSLSHSSPFSSELASDSSLSPGFLPSVLGMISSQNLQRKPGRMANLGPATTCPDSHRSPGRRTPFAPPLGEGLLLPQPPQQTTHMAGLGGSGKPPLTTHRAGTQGVYSAHWDGWVRWCSDHSVPPHNPSSCDLANFLAFLSCVKGLSASSIKVHRSAVCTTIRQMGGPTFSDDPLLRDLVRGAALAEAKSPRRIPSWDLFLVLSALRLPPYEPLKQSSLKHLTLKTAFLVSLASGRRCNEVHALSGLPGDVAFEPDGSMSLRFLPDFLAKNQLPGSPSPVISIRSLSSILAPDDEDLFLCPVRALRAYRKRTKSFRSKQRRLLLSWNENYKDDIRRSTISRWLREVITAAYARPGSELAVFSPRPHEIRAWASSLAFASNVSLSSLMEAAYWRSPGTFIHFYLRDVSRLREDGSRGIASAVVAQQTISASCAPLPSSSSRH